jgi:REP element-mobilizing transposase RayT
MAHSFSKLLTHIIFSTKDRQPFLDDALKEDLFHYMGGVVRECDGAAEIINGPADHVHLLIRFPTTQSVADLLRVVKTNSSRWVHQTYPERRAFGWQTGYGAFSVSQSNAEQVREYIARQEEHHRRVTFQEEFVAFLKRHGIEYDERYIWE